MWSSCTFLFLAFVRNINLPYAQVDETNSLRQTHSYVEFVPAISNASRR